MDCRSLMIEENLRRVVCEVELIALRAAGCSVVEEKGGEAPEFLEEWARRQDDCKQRQFAENFDQCSASRRGGKNKSTWHLKYVFYGKTSDDYWKVGNEKPSEKDFCGSGRRGAKVAGW